MARRYLLGLQWWLSRGDTASIARFGRRAAEAATRLAGLVLGRLE